MDSNRPSISKIRLSDQGEDSISYGEGLRPEPENPFPTTVGDALDVSTADTPESASLNNDEVDEIETFPTITFDDLTDADESKPDPIGSNTEFQNPDTKTVQNEEQVVSKPRKSPHISRERRR